MILLKCYTVTARCKAWVCRRSFLVVAGSNPTGGAYMDVSFVSCQGRGLCDGLITRPEESYGCLSIVIVVCCQVEVCATG